MSWFSEQNLKKTLSWSHCRICLSSSMGGSYTHLFPYISSGTRFNEQLDRVKHCTMCVQPVLLYCTLDQVEDKLLNLVYLVQLLILLNKSGPWLRHFSFQNSVSLVTQLDLSGPQPSRMLWIKQKTGLSVDSHVSGIGAVKAGCVIQ